MKRGKEMRNASGQLIGPTTAHEVMVLMFVMVEQSAGAFSLRFVSNDDLLHDLEKQGALQTFLRDVDQLYTDFRKRFTKTEGDPN